MVKAFVNGVIVLGLSDRNLKLLQEGRPIKINLEELGLPSQILIIMHGKTESEIEKDLLENSGRIDTNIKPNQN